MSDKNDSGENQFDRSLHEQTTRKVEALPHLVNQTVDPLDDVPLGLEEDTRPVEEEAEAPPKLTARRQPHWTPTSQAQEKASQAQEQASKAQDKASKAQEQDENPAQAAAARRPEPDPEEKPESNSKDFSIELNDEFFDNLFD